MVPEILVCKDLRQASQQAALLFAEALGAAVAQKGLATMALAGGKTPRTVYEMLAQPPFVTKMPWQNLHFFWVDERCVPPEHPESNYGMAKKAFLASVPVPEKNIHRIPAEIVPSQEAAQRYQMHLKDFFKSLSGKELPSFDVMLLGIGSDGHTASLFVNDPALEEKEDWAAVAHAPAGISPNVRITLTLPVINKARTIFFLVSGGSKKRIVEEILNDSPAAWQHYPAARVKAAERLVWLVDESAASADRYFKGEN